MVGMTRLTRLNQLLIMRVESRLKVPQLEAKLSTAIIHVIMQY